MKKHLLFFKASLVALILTSSSIGWTQPGTSVTEAISIDVFPHTETGVDTEANGVYLGAGTLGGTTCNNLNCCPALVYKVTLPSFGSLRVENENYAINSGSIIAYTSSVNNPTAWSDLEYWNVLGNFCGLKDTMQLGTFCNWQDETAPFWESNLGGTALDPGDPEHVAPPGVYYVLIMNYNQYSGTGGTGTDFTFKFFPYNSCDPTTGIDVQESCDSYTWIDGNTYTSSNSTATHTLTNAAGCDSVVTLNLIINESTSGIDVQESCDSYTWIDGNTYTSSNSTATHTLTNAAGCDSVVTLNLTINESTSGIDVQESCDSYTWIDGNTYTSSNSTATHTLTNAAGCDSVVTLNLTINESTSGIDVQESCDSYTWIDGNTYTSSNNTATHTLTNAAGCDSVVTLNLTINESTSGIDVQESCDSYTWIDGNTYTSSNNTAMHTLINAVGCDSVVTLDLTINIVDTSISVTSGNTLMANLDGATYQWLDCDNNYSAIVGETNQSFTASENGNYAVQIDDGDCIDTSSCYVITGIGVEEMMSSKLRVYPNPSDGLVNIDFQKVISPTIMVYSSIGNLVFSETYEHMRKISIKLDVKSGVYNVMAFSNNGEKIASELIIIR